MTTTAFASLEEIGAWAAAKQFVLEVYTVSAQGTFSQNAHARDQVRKECVAILSNMVEGTEREEGRTFGEFLRQAKKSVVEVRTQLYGAVDKGYLSSVTFDRLYALATDVTRQMDELSAYLTKEPGSG